MWILFASWLQAAGPPPSLMLLPEPPKSAVPQPLVLAQRCDSRGEDAVVVCGRHPDRFRLPLPNERAQPVDTRTRGEAPAPLAAITPFGRCGLFAGERRCGKAEAAKYGYGGGRDPLTVLAELGTVLLDGDADRGPPADIPKHAR